ncbi:flippase [Haladaptatus sp. CMAA 1911]|uniref:flippase n=1 Tax=unclassified Haladaptatus TaxID=2622732 RepID=UPI003754CFA7
MSNVENAFHRFVQGTALVFIGDILGAGSSFVVRLGTARYLGPDNYGIIVLGITVVEVLSIVSLLGLPEGIARNLGRTDEPSTMYAPLLASISTAGIFAVGLVLFSNQIVSFFHEPKFLPVLIVFAASLPFVVLTRLIVGIFRGLEKSTWRVVVQNVLNQTGTAVAVGVGVVLGLRPVGITGSWFVAPFVATLIGIYFLYGHTNLFDISEITRSLTGPLSWELLLFSLPLVVSRSLWSLMEQSDNFILGYFKPSSVVGVYDAAFTVPRVLLVVHTAIGFLFLPIFSDLATVGDADEMDRFYKLVTKWMALVSLPVYCLILAFPKPILSITFGAEYESATNLLLLISTGFFIHIIAGINEHGLIALGRTRTILRGNIMCLSLNILLNVTLIPSISAFGAALASVSAYIAVNSYWTYRLFSYSGVFPISWTTAKVLLLGFISFFGSLIAVESVFGRTIGAMVLFTILFVFSYLIVLFVHIEPEEIRFFHMLTEERS